MIVLQRERWRRRVGVSVWCCSIHIGGMSLAALQQLASFSLSSSLTSISITEGSHQWYHLHC
jgi:hypothetical protein